MVRAGEREEDSFHFFGGCPHPQPYVDSARFDGAGEELGFANVKGIIL
jgi:hypothetical protein